MIVSKCNKEPNMPVVITVKMQSDTNVVVPNATVKIAKGDTKVEGITDAYGQFRHTYKLEAIFDVTADLDTLHGVTIVRLKPDQTVYKTVFIQ